MFSGVNNLMGSTPRSGAAPQSQETQEGPSFLDRMAERYGLRRLPQRESGQGESPYNSAKVTVMTANGEEKITLKDVSVLTSEGRETLQLEVKKDPSTELFYNEDLCDSVLEGLIKKCKLGEASDQFFNKDVRRTNEVTYHTTGDDGAPLKIALMDKHSGAIEGNIEGFKRDFSLLNNSQQAAVGTIGTQTAVNAVCLNLFELNSEHNPHSSAMVLNGEKNRSVEIFKSGDDTLTVQTTFSYIPDESALKMLDDTDMIPSKSFEFKVGASVTNDGEINMLPLKLSPVGGLGKTE